MSPNGASRRPSGRHRPSRPARYAGPPLVTRVYRSAPVRIAGVTLAVVALVASSLATGRGTARTVLATIDAPSLLNLIGAGEHVVPPPYVWVPPSESVATPSAPKRTTPASPTVTTLAGDGIPTVALEAYQAAGAIERLADPGCRLPWPLVAAIGRVESDHGRFGGSSLRRDGSTTRRIVGPALDGHGTTLVHDSDRGTLDGDRVYDRAVGPMQFIPTTWQAFGVDANGDHRADPFNIIDAAASAARYLCAGQGDLSTISAQVRAVRAYNDSDEYLRLVLSIESTYARDFGGIAVPTPPAGTLPTGRSDTPPVNPGALLGVQQSPSAATPAATGGATATPAPPPTATPTSPAATSQPVDPASTNQPSSASPTSPTPSTSPAGTAPAGSSVPGAGSPPVPAPSRS
ncbi:MAG: hypothetical protein QOE97_2983 [Pseudonocardiales bacterium]|nr:hypothetical protein [Pseudonocardiales bacterium]